jgi:DNA polymerase/3'-5' exonuclease PolX
VTYIHSSAADDGFKSRAFRNASTAMEECEEEITSEAQAKKMKIKGIGKGSQKLVQNVLLPQMTATMYILCLQP